MLNDWVVGTQRQHSREIREEPSLSRALFDRERHGFLNVASLSSNVKAVEASMLFAGGLTPFVALVGGSGWGKTNLLNAAASTLRSALGATPKVMNAIDWVNHGQHADSHSPLLLDNMQAVLNSPRMRQKARLMLEWRVRLVKPTLAAFTAPISSRQLSSLLPTPREWNIAHILEPNLEERMVVVRHLAAGEGLLLSERIVRLLSHRVKGNGRTLAGCVHRLKLIQSRWMEPEAVLRACGVLQPFLSSADGWDIRDHISEMIERLWSRYPVDESAIRRKDMCVYLMMHIVGLSEEDVASYYRLSPGEAYAVANRVATQRQQGQLGDVPERCIDGLLASLDPV